ncbi:MAG: type II secretion system protein [Erysipelotrichaceae bacterium]
MAKQQHTSPSIAYLVEIIIVILFFAISSAICIQVFVSAHHLSVDAINRNHALMNAQKVIEEAKHKNQIEEDIQYDEDWERINTKGKYHIVMNQKGDHYQLIAYEKEKELTKIEFSLPQLGGDYNE